MTSGRSTSSASVARTASSVSVSGTTKSLSHTARPRWTFVRQW